MRPALIFAPLIGQDGMCELSFGKFWSSEEEESKLALKEAPIPDTRST
jgi:hypothetical protein